MLIRILLLVLPTITAFFTSNNGAIFYNNTTLFAIKGVNFFGFETCDYVVHGLWAHPMTWYLDFLQQNNFNVVRLPFSQQWINEGFETQQPSYGTIKADPSIYGLTSVQIMDKFFDECEVRGMFVILDMHRLKCEAQSHELWYSLDSKQYTNVTFFDAWKKILQRYSSRPNFHAIDLLNEPRGLASWGDDPSTSWNLFIESAFNQHLPDYDGLIYVEGLDWGRSFQGMPALRVNQSRIVYSPHVYGPSVVGNVELDPVKLHAEWNKVFGYLVPQKKTVVIGEFGGRYFDADRLWQGLFVDYLISIRVPGIYWSLNPNSGDTGGLLEDDWTTPVYDKLKLLERLQPKPTIVLRRNHANLLRKRCK